MILRMSPGLTELADVEFNNNVDFESGSCLVASTSLCSDKEDSDISSARSSCKGDMVNFLAVQEGVFTV